MHIELYKNFPALLRKLKVQESANGRHLRHVYHKGQSKQGHIDKEKDKTTLTKMHIKVYAVSYIKAHKSTKQVDCKTHWNKKTRDTLGAQKKWFYGLILTLRRMRGNAGVSMFFLKMLFL